MRDQAAVAAETGEAVAAKLSRSELLSLRDEALEWAQRSAGEWASGPDEERESYRLEMEAAMYVYGACQEHERVFRTCKGIRDEADEYAEVSFVPEAAQFLRERQSEYRPMLERMRATVEMEEQAKGQVFFLFVLDGIFGKDGES